MSRGYSSAVLACSERSCCFYFPSSFLSTFFGSLLRSLCVVCRSCGRGCSRGRVEVLLQLVSAGFAESSRDFFQFLTQTSLTAICMESSIPSACLSASLSFSSCHNARVLWTLCCRVRKKLSPSPEEGSSMIGCTKEPRGKSTKKKQDSFSEG